MLFIDYRRVHIVDFVVVEFDNSHFQLERFSCKKFNVIVNKVQIIVFFIYLHMTFIIHTYEIRRICILRHTILFIDD